MGHGKKLLILFALLLLSCSITHAGTTPVNGSVLATDNCTRADATDLGPNYTAVWGTGWRVTSNHCNVQGWPSAAKYTGGSSWATLGGTGDQYATVTWASWPTSNNYSGPFVRIQADGKSGYKAYCNWISGSICKRLAITRIDSGTSTDLGSYVMDIAAGVPVSISAEGSLIRIFVNGNPVYAVTDVTYSGGSPGVYGGDNIVAAAGATFIEFGNMSTAGPIISPPAGLVPSTTQITLQCSKTPSDIYYTSDGSVPTHLSPLYAAPFNVPVGSGTFTLKVICVYAGVDSEVASSVYTVADDQTGAYSISVNFADFFHADEDPTLQTPLTWWNTSGNLTAVPAPGSALINSSVGLRNGAYRLLGSNYLVYTGATFANDQYARITISDPESYQTTGVGVRVSTDGKNGYFLAYTGGRIVLYYLSAGAKYDIASTTTTVTSGSTLELRVVGTVVQPLYNGAPVTGLGGSYTRFNFSSGSPAIVGGGKDFVAGTINAGSPLTLATWNGVASSSKFTGWPTYGVFGWQTSSGSPNPSVPSEIGWLKTGSAVGWGTLGMVQISGASYAYGLYTNSMTSAMNLPGLYRPEQWSQVTIMVDTVDPRNIIQNWFITLQHKSKILPDVSGCYDQTAYYIGVEPMYQWNPTAPVPTRAGCNLTLEYCGTNYLHITKVTPQSSVGGTCSGNANVWPVAGSAYIPMAGDTILSIYEGGRLKVYCKDGGRGALAPGAMGCPHAAKFVKIIDVADTDLQNASGYPGLWVGGTSSHIGIPLFQNFSAGSMGVGTQNPCSLGQCEETIHISVGWIW